MSGDGDGDALAADGLIARPNFLSRQECASIRAELAFARWYPSTVVESIEGGRAAGRISPCRVSETTDESWFTPQLARELRRIERKLAAFLPGLSERRECWQATRYFRGGKFRAHMDCGHWRDEPAGDREHTVLIFLNTPRAGGETCFPYLARAFRPEAGLVLAWRNLREGRSDRRMLHTSLPILAGRKMVLVTWLRQRAFERKAA